MSDCEVVVVSNQNPLIAAVAQFQVEDLWAEFLRLQISAHTKRTYAVAIDDFFVRITGSPATPVRVAEFLKLSQHQALAIVLKYKADLTNLNLAPATINVRLSAIKSLVTHARKLGECQFNLADIKNVKVQTYQDTSGVKPKVFKSILDGIERGTVAGKRDYAILRLLWDNALRRGEIGRGEIEGLTINRFQDNKLWIKGKGRTQTESIDLSVKTIMALEEWLLVRGSSKGSDPLFIALDNRSFGC